MKLTYASRLLIAILALASFGFTSCESYQKGATQASIYAPAAAEMAAQVVLYKATSPEDLVNKAVLLNKIASILKTFDPENKPTGFQITQMVKDALPKKTHWTIFATAIGYVYTTQVSKYSDDQLAPTMMTLKGIADRLEKAAKPHLPAEVPGPVAEIEA